MRYLLYFSLGILFSTCTLKNNDISNSRTSFKQDSINKWITESTNSKLPAIERGKNLKNAFNQIDNIDNDSIQTVLFSRLSLAYLMFSDSLMFRKTNEKTISLAKKINDSIILANAHWDLGEFFKNNAFADSTYFHFSKAQKIFQSLEDEHGAATMLNNMAVVQMGVKDYTGSEITSIRAIEILNHLNDNEQLYKSYNNLGAVTTELKEYERALNYYDKALSFQDKIRDENSYDLSIKNNIGVVYQEQENYKESVPYFNEVLSKRNLLKTHPSLFAMALNNLAHSKSKTYPELDLSKQFKRAIRIQDSLNDIPSVSRSHYSFAEYYLSRNDTAAALDQAKKARKYAQVANNNDRVLQTLQLLTRLDPENSSAYNQRYIALNDSLQEEERQIRDKFARIRFETDEYIAENEVLESETRLWAGIAFAIFLLGASAFVILDQRSKNQKLRFQQQQQASNQEIFNLMLAQKQKEEEGKKAEQKRISEELHDGVLGRMLGARMVLTGLNKKSDSEAELQREKAIDALQDVEKEVRAISHELSHSAYRKMHNFMLSLQDLIKTVGDTSNIDCQLVFDDTKDWDALNGDIKINTYRMVQESLQNAVKHARCEQVTVTFASQNETLRVAIADDGKGFRPKKGKRGIGMRNIASRIEKLNGRWHLESSPGNGTTVVLEIPVTGLNKDAQKTKMKQLTQEA